MNNQRRNQLRDIQQELRDIYARLDGLYEEEQAAYGNMPESLQDSEQGEQAQNAIDTIETIRDQVLEAADGIDDIFN